MILFLLMLSVVFIEIVYEAKFFFSQYIVFWGIYFEVCVHNYCSFKGWLCRLFFGCLKVKYAIFDCLNSDFSIWLRSCFGVFITPQIIVLSAYKDFRLFGFFSTYCRLKGVCKFVFLCIILFDSRVYLSVL